MTDIILNLEPTLQLRCLGECVTEEWDGARINLGIIIHLRVMGLMYPDEDDFTLALSQTILHELLHKLIDDITYPNWVFEKNQHYIISIIEEEVFPGVREKGKIHWENISTEELLLAMKYFKGKQPTHWEMDYIV